MRSAPEARDPDRTARATIRDTALALFADKGPDAVTVREIAAAAGVSPALVLHHFGSKDGLRAVVDDHAAGAFDAMLARLEGGDLAEVLGGGEPASLAEAFAAEFRAGSPLVLYLRRLLLSGDPAGTALVRRWHTLTLGLVERLEEAGVGRPSRDREARAALLLAGDLAVVLLAPHLGAVLGENPLTPAGMARWTAEATDVYLHGAFLAPPEATDPPTAGPGGDPT
ncbi:TetR/AcrR family transcriptional regulator [Phycicoccus sonneratiae]|uniref:Helix-turn-helix transcriptional regulator n=1 Tax=Phycicoccus sonneratiae TaxID=2807628 RepID=A0ABS2CKF2_9MICO|nr:helix-turn-helix domain-containing protein [Phycicoccus sonneraticus]MBM6400290.1 helix-turn-helix transcriptional regulator [Phycicoccus sonneraticus]